MKYETKRRVLNCEKSGQGPVVLFHDYLSFLRYWDELRSVLERDHTVIAVDLLGFGNSPKPRDSQYDYDEHLEWIEHTLEACDLRGPWYLRGILWARCLRCDMPQGIQNRSGT
jgi:pimeloyl-ACP methyl ester carboxylesterase